MLRLIFDAIAYPKYIQEISFLALVVPAGIFVFLRLGDVKPFIVSLSIAFLYIIPLTFSFLFVFISGSADQLFAAVTFFNILFMFVLASIFSSSPGCDLWMITMRKIAFLLCPFFIFIALTEQKAYVWGRWHPLGGQPNWWGMMGLGLTWCAFNFKNICVKGFFIALGLYYLLLTQARGSLVAFLPAFVFCSGYFFPFTRRKTIFLVLLLLIGSMLLLYVTFSMRCDLIGDVYSYVVNDIMQMDDPYRGVSSGLTNRMEGFRIAWRSFLDSPLLGAGYSEFSFVHNGFLVILAETGVFSFFGAMALFVFGLKGYIKTNYWKGAGYILSYMVLLLTYPRTFNINMVSILFVMILMRGTAFSVSNNPSKVINPGQLAGKSTTIV